MKEELFKFDEFKTWFNFSLSVEGYVVWNHQVDLFWYETQISSYQITNNQIYLMSQNTQSWQKQTSYFRNLGAKKFF